MLLNKILLLIYKLSLISSSIYLTLYYTYFIQESECRAIPCSEEGISCQNISCCHNLICYENTACISNNSKYN